jgi:ribosomal protein S14
MLSLKIKDLKNRNLYLKNEKKNIVNRFLFIYFLSKPNVKKKKLFLIYLLFLKNKSTITGSKLKTKIVRRCLISNRNRSNFRPYNISRFIVRNLMQFGILPGFKKAVW